VAQAETGQTIETMFLEERRYQPPPEFAAQANAQPDIYERDFEEFWETEGRERLTWFEPFTKLYEWEPPYASGTSAGSSTSASTASTATSKRGTATASPTSGRASPRATAAR
jgi:hypothetical protein